MVTSVIILIITLLMPELMAFRILSRSTWGGQEPQQQTRILEKLTYVIIHHSYIPEACVTLRDCSKAMRFMQHMHVYDNNWDDIGYNYAVGGDGNIYEGRGFGIEGAHSPGYNNNSIGIVFIGDWSENNPHSSMLTAAKELINYGISKGYLKSNYILYGHRQVRDGTDCPGDALYENIQTWDRWQE